MYSHPVPNPAFTSQAPSRGAAGKAVIQTTKPQSILSPANLETRDKLDVCAAVFTARTFVCLPDTDLSPCQELRAQQVTGQCHQMEERRALRGKSGLRSSHQILQGGKQQFSCENRSSHDRVGWNHVLSWARISCAKVFVTARKKVCWCQGFFLVFFVVVVIGFFLLFFFFSFIPLLLPSNSI